MVWAALVQVSGSIPEGGILPKMCACACNAFAHSLARNFHLRGSSLGRSPYSRDAYPARKTVSWGRRAFPVLFWVLLAANYASFSEPPHLDTASPKIPKKMMHSTPRLGSRNQTPIIHSGRPMVSGGCWRNRDRAGLPMKSWAIHVSPKWPLFSS